MNCLVPDYYPAFQCSGSRCTDNCCIGWEICIDADTLAYYQKVDGAIGQTLAHAIAAEEPPHFILDDDKRCPFLNEQNLCQLHIQLGEEHLCSICAQHPRFHNWFGSYKESGLGLCCEQAAQLILFSQGSGFVETTTPEPPDPDSTVDPDLLQSLKAVRQTVFSILNHRQLPLSHRLCLIVALAQDLQSFFDQAQQTAPLHQQTVTEFYITTCQSIAEFYGDASCYSDFIHQVTCALADTSTCQILPQLLQFHGHLTANDSAWPQRLSQLEQTFSQIEKTSLPNDTGSGLQRIAAYFVYRYFLPAALQGDILGGLLPAVIAVLVIGLLHQDTLYRTGSLTPWQQICNAKAYSKEVEYSPENQEQLNNAIWTEDFFAPSALMGCLLQKGGI